MSMQAASDAPRFRHLSGQSVLLEDGIAPEVVADLVRRGHDLSKKPYRARMRKSRPKGSRSFRPLQRFAGASFSGPKREPKKSPGFHAGAAGSLATVRINSAVRRAKAPAEGQWIGRVRSSLGLW